MSRPRKRRSGALLMLILMVAFVSVLAVGAWGWQRYQAFADSPLTGLQPGGSISVERGDSLPAVVARLHSAGVGGGERYEWQLLGRQLDAASRLHVGEYALEPGTTPRGLLMAMRQGDTIRYRFTLVEGWSFRELRAALAKAQPLQQDAAALSTDALMSALGHAGEHPEGRFLPETYIYGRGDSDLDVLRRAYDAMEKALAEAWAQRAPDSRLKTPYEMLIMASIVEKESGIAEERPQIAGLFDRRLKIGMRLQTDPTVIYGIGEDYDGNIRRIHLTTDTPYNTYTRDGLPPTPIAMPGKEALQAVANPAPGDALYFVAVGDGSGRHLFARTLAEHNANVRRYLQNYRQRARANAGGGETP